MLPEILAVNRRLIKYESASEDDLLLSLLD